MPSQQARDRPEPHPKPKVNETLLGGVLGRRNGKTESTAKDFLLLVSFMVVKQQSNTFYEHKALFYRTLSAL